MLRAGVKHDMESIGVKNADDIRNVVVSSDGRIIINRRKSISQAEAVFLPAALRQRISDIAFMNSLETHGKVIFTSEGFEPENVKKVGDTAVDSIGDKTSGTETAGAVSKKAGSKTPDTLQDKPIHMKRARIGEDGRIYFNTAFFDAKFRKLGVTLERVGGEGPEGRNVFKVGGEPLSAGEFLAANDVPLAQRAAVKKARRALLEEMKIGKTHEVVHRIVEYSFKDDPDELVSGLRNIFGVGDKAQVLNAGDRKVPFEWTFENAQELASMIGETAPRKGKGVEIVWQGKKIKVSAKQVEALEGLIREKAKKGLVKIPSEFSFSGARRYDTHLLARELPTAFARGKTAFSTVEPAPLSVDSRWLGTPLRPSRVDTLEDLDRALYLEQSMDVKAKAFEQIISSFIQVIRTGNQKSIDAFIKKHEGQLNSQLLTQFSKDYERFVSDTSADMSTPERFARFEKRFKEGQISNLRWLIYRKMYAEQQAARRLLSDIDTRGKPKTAAKIAEDMKKLQKLIKSNGIELNDNIIRVLGSEYYDAIQNGRTKNFDFLPEPIKKRVLEEVVRIHFKNPEIVSDFTNKRELTSADIQALLALPPKLTATLLTSGVYKKLKISPKELIGHLQSLDARDIEILEHNVKELNPSQIQSVITRKYEPYDGGRLRVYEAAFVGRGGVAEVTGALCHIVGQPLLLDVVIKRAHKTVEGADVSLKNESGKAKRFDAIQERHPQLREHFMETVYADDTMIIYKNVGGRSKDFLTVGEALESKLRDPDTGVEYDRYSRGDVVNMCGTAMLGMAVAHQNGISHRDIKPENLIFSGGKSTWIDFGSMMTGTEAREVRYMYKRNDGVIIEIPADIPPNRVQEYLLTQKAIVLSYRDAKGEIFGVDATHPLPAGTPVENIHFAVVPEHAGAMGGVTPGYFDLPTALAASRGKLHHTKEDYPAMAQTLSELFVVGVEITDGGNYLRTAPARKLPPAAEKQLLIYIEALRHPERKLDPSDPNSQPVKLEEVGMWLLSLNL